MFRLEAIMPPTEAIFYLINLAVAASLACGMGLLSARICRRGSAPLRHGVLLCTLAVVLAAPVAALLAQRNGFVLIRVAFVDKTNAQKAINASSNLPSEQSSPRQSLTSARGGQWTDGATASSSPREWVNTPVLADRSRPAADDGAASSIAPARWPIAWQFLGSTAAWLWAVGVLVELVRLGSGYVALARFCRRLRRSPDSQWNSLVRHAADAVGLRNVPSVFVSSAAGVPMSIGLFTPAIVLPEALSDEMNEEQLQTILLHEAAHIARHDHWAGVAQCIAVALFWWNPLVRRTCDEISELREEICDNYVVLFQGEGRLFARILVELAARATAWSQLPSTVGVLEPKLAGLSGRVSRLLNKERNLETRMNLRSKMFAFTCSLAVLSGMTFVGGLRLASAKTTDVQPVASDSTTPSSQKTTQAAQSPTQSPNLSAIQKMLAEKYPAVDRSKLNEAAIQGMLQSLNDPNAAYISSDKIADIKQFVEGELVGVGVEIRKYKNRIEVAKVLPHSPAESAGLQAGGELLEIDGQAVTEDLAGVARMIRGTPDTTVKIKVRKTDGTTADFVIPRRSIQIPSISGLWRNDDNQRQYWLDFDRKLGYVRINSIDANTPKLTEEAIRQLKERGLQGLVLDLRDLPGGLLSSGLDVVGLFQKDGRLLTVKRKDGEENFEADGMNWMGDFPLVVLINNNTTSAGEVMAGVLQLRGRAVLVGDRTFGKGTVQSIFDIDGREALKLTLGEMILPNGRRLQRIAGDAVWGVDPDDGFYVPMTVAERKAASAAREKNVVGEAPLTPEKIEKDLSDPQLAAAVKTLSAKVADGEFTKVGQPVAALTAQLERLRLQRDETLARLKQLDGELGLAK